MLNIFKKEELNEKEFEGKKNKEGGVEDINEDELVNELIDKILQQPKKLDILKSKIKKSNLQDEINKFLKEKEKQLPVTNIRAMEKKLKDYLFGYGKIECLINDPNISDIKIMSYDNIRIKVMGERKTSSIKFKSNEEFIRFTNLTAMRNHINLADINACQTFSDNSNPNFMLRINITTGYINSTGTPYVHFRKIPKHKRTKEELIKAGLATKEEFNYLTKMIKEGKSIIFAGKGGSGKTTLMNYLIDQIPENKAGLAIQENEELFSSHPEIMFQRVRTSNGDGNIQYTLKDLAINGLLIDIDYFIIGEVKGAEAKYIMTACYTGHTCMTSVHAINSKKALEKLVDYMKYESDYTREDLLKMISSIEVIVFNRDFKIKEISEVNSWDEEKKDLTFNMIFKDGKKIKESKFEGGE